jgi:epoxyqueuosine reductase
MSETDHLTSFINHDGIDVYGIADLGRIERLSEGTENDPSSFRGRYTRAVIMGVQLGKLGKSVSGIEADLYLEKAALEVQDYLERRGYPGLIIHPEDEFDPVNRFGLVSLKVLAKEAGLGWQGRSLLIISPQYGPIHRLIAVATNMPLNAGHRMAGRCGRCTLCIKKCPAGALTLQYFDDRPARREDVLDITKCKGDDGCLVCLEVCPWRKQTGMSK